MWIDTYTQTIFWANFESSLRMFISYGRLRKFTEITRHKSKFRTSLVDEFIINSKFKLLPQATSHQR